MDGLADVAALGASARRHPLPLSRMATLPQNEEFAEDDLEPAVPAGLGELSAPLHSLIEFLGIDEDLVEVAASASAPLNASPDREELAAWIQRLPEKEKNNLLVVAVSGPGERWKNELLRRFEQHKALRTLPEPDEIRRRTAGDLLTFAHARAEERERLLEAKRAAEAARRKAEDEANRARYLDQLEKGEEATWNQIAAHILKRQPNEYDKAITVLIDPARSCGPARPGDCIPVRRGGTPPGARRQGKSSAPVD